MTDQNTNDLTGREVSSKSESDKNTVVIELQFELLKQFAWLGSAIIGGIVVLIQLGKITLGNHVYVSMACLAMSIVISVQGQDYLVNKLTDGSTLQDIAMRMKLIRLVSFGLIFFSIGIMVSQFMRM